MERNIYEKLLNVEDDYTNALCNLLCQEEFRKIIESGFNLNEIFGRRINNIETNKAKENGGKPDAILEFDGITVLLEVKVSTWRGLTKNQPESYLDYLRKINGKSVFVLLIPIGYEHLNEFNKRYNEWETTNRVEIQKRVVYWQDIYKAIKSSNYKRSILTDFADMLELEHMEEIISMNENELAMLESKEIYQFNKKVKDIINSTVSKLKRDGIDCSKCNDDDGLNYYVYDNKGKIAFWFGQWDQTQEIGYSLVVGCHKKHTFVEKFLLCQRINDQYFEPLSRSNIEKPENVVQDFLKLIIKYYG